MLVVGSSVGAGFRVHLNEGLPAGLSLSIEYHVDSLVNNVFGMIPQELEYVLDLGLVWEPPQPDAVLPGAGRDELLGYHSHGGQPGGSWLGQAAQQGRGAPSPGPALARVVVLGRSVENLLNLGSC